MRRRASAALLGAALSAGSGLATARSAEAQQAGDTLARRAAAAADSDFVVVQGRLFTADGRPPAGLRVFIRADERTDSADVQPDGSFVLLPQPPAADTVEVFVDAADRERRWYFPSYVRLEVGGLGEELRFVLVPRVWIPPSGTYAGKPIRIDLVEAFRQTAHETEPRSFYPRRRVRAGSTRAPRSITISWPDSALPIPVVFVRDSAGPRISAADSSGFWAGLAEMEQDYGSRLFVPARYDDLFPGDTARGSVITIRVDPGLAPMGQGGPGPYRGRDYHRGNASFRSPSDLRNRFLVTHELTHVLGFRHTCSWASILATDCPDRRLRALRLGPHDVAHIQVYRRVHALQRQLRAFFGLLEALNGQRVLMLGLPPETGTIVVP